MKAKTKEFIEDGVLFYLIITLLTLPLSAYLFRIGMVSSDSIDYNRGICKEYFNSSWDSTFKFNESTIRIKLYRNYSEYSELQHFYTTDGYNKLIIDCGDETK